MSPTHTNYLVTFYSRGTSKDKPITFSHFSLFLNFSISLPLDSSPAHLRTYHTACQFLVTDLDFPSLTIVDLPSSSHLVSLTLPSSTLPPLTRTRYEIYSLRRPAYLRVLAWLVDAMLSILDMRFFMVTTKAIGWFFLFFYWVIFHLICFLNFWFNYMPYFLSRLLQERGEKPALMKRICGVLGMKLYRWRQSEISINICPYHHLMLVT